MAETDTIWREVDRSEPLPQECGCYLIYCAGKPLYAGSAKNFRARFRLHQIDQGFIDGREFDGDPGEVRVLFLRCDGLKTARRVEAKLIRGLQPALNTSSPRSYEDEDSLVIPSDVIECERLKANDADFPDGVPWDREVARDLSARYRNTIRDVAARVGGSRSYVSAVWLRQSVALTKRRLEVERELVRAFNQRIAASA